MKFTTPELADFGRISKSAMRKHRMGPLYWDKFKSTSLCVHQDKYKSTSLRVQHEHINPSNFGRKGGIYTFIFLKSKFYLLLPIHPSLLVGS